MSSVSQNAVKKQQETYNKLAVFGPPEYPALQDMRNVNRLCGRCQNANWEAVEFYLVVAQDNFMYPAQPIYQSNPTVADVKKSAHAGCHFCSLTLAVLQSCRYRYSIDIDVVPPTIENVTEDSWVEVSIGIVDSPPSARLEFKVLPDNEAGNLSGCCNLIGLTVSSEGFAFKPDHMLGIKPESLAKHWLTDCLNNHDLCTHQTSLLPRRIIDVSQEPLRLVLPESRNDHYATMSYTIGGAHLVTTTSENIAERQRGFGIDILPQAIQDIIWWTRQLGIQYLWVDSLCILQDTLSDWELELSTMSDVYRNSTVTIAASAIQSAHQGCKPRQNKLALTPCRVRPNLAIMPDADRMTWSFGKAPLDSRAWCMQEVELSQRVLRVGCEELAWQCRTSKILETRPLDPISHLFGFQTPSDGSRVLDSEGRMVSGGAGHETAKKRPFNVWYTLISRFARKNLSFPNDKLPALSGLAEYFQKKLQGTYVAGLWKEDIFHGLLWTMEREGHCVPYRGPSWSWTAVEAGWLAWYVPLLGLDGAIFELLDVRVVVGGLNPFGHVRSARITLLAPTATLPPRCFGDESVDSADLWDWINSVHLLRWDRGMAQVGCVLLRLHPKAFLILEPNTKYTYVRVGTLLTPSEFSGKTELVMDMLDHLEWIDKVITIL